MHIGILKCGSNRPEWLAKHGDFGDWFAPLLKPVCPTLKFTIYAADEGELPASIRECDAWLLTGSPVSVGERHPWQRALDAFVREAHGKVPMVGICYGHQHLHDALGGEVGRRESWGVGVQNYSVCELPDWLPAAIAKASAGGMRLIALHQDDVTRPAPATRILAGNDDCGLAVTMIGEDILTFQAHPEMTAGYVTKIYDLHRQSIGESDWRAAQDSLSGRTDERLAAEWILAFLVSRVTDPDDSLPSKEPS